MPRAAVFRDIARKVKTERIFRKRNAQRKLTTFFFTQNLLGLQ